MQDKDFFGFFGAPSVREGDKGTRIAQRSGLNPRINRMQAGGEGRQKPLGTSVGVLCKIRYIKAVDQIRMQDLVHENLV